MRCHGGDSTWWDCQTEYCRSFQYGVDGPCVVRDNLVALRPLNAGIIDRQQFTILLGAVIGSAVIPTVVAQRWFALPLQALKAEEIVEIEDEEFEPPRPQSAKKRKVDSRNPA